MVSLPFIWLANASLLGLTAAVSCPSNTNTGMTDTMRDDFLDEHNMRRSDVAEGAIPLGPRGKLCPTAARMPKLTYDCNLEKNAYEFARQCSLGGSPESSRQNQGENFLAAPFNGNLEEAGIRAINEWFNEITRKGMNRQMNFTPGIPLVKPRLTSFTQMVWAATTKVGCAVVRCNNNQAFTVCRYSPRGNIVRQKVYNLGPVCSGCPSNCDRAFGLCNTP